MATAARDGAQPVEVAGREPGHASLLSGAVLDIDPAGIILALRPEIEFGLLTQDIEIGFDVEIELLRFADQGLGDLLPHRQRASVYHATYRAV